MRRLFVDAMSLRSIALLRVSPRTAHNVTDGFPSHHAVSNVLDGTASAKEPLISIHAGRMRASAHIAQQISSGSLHRVNVGTIIGAESIQMSSRSNL